MVRWRYCLFLAMLLLVPVRTGPKSEDDDDDQRTDDNGGNDEEEEEDDEDDDNSPPVERREDHGPPTAGRRAAVIVPTQPATQEVTRTVPRRPLECYVCAYKAETQLRSCLDPTKFRVHTMVCHSADDKCFTSVISKESAYETVVRGCRSGCLSTSETTCCELNRCNNQALAMPTPPPVRQQLTSGKPNKAMPSVLFFVTILLVLQTVVKVAFV